MSAVATAPKTFVWDKDYQNHEQVRPYFKDYLRVRAEIRASGTYTYNDLFKGRIPGLAESENEDTGIYMLQNLFRLDEKRDQMEAFVAAGGAPLTEFDLEGKILRGTLARHGWYSGGTGYAERENVRVTVSQNRVMFKEPRQRSWRTEYASPEQYLFQQD